VNDALDREEKEDLYAGVKITFKTNRKIRRSSE